MRKKKMIITLVILLAIGFASVSTTLMINGLVGIGSKKDDFNIIFTNAKLNNIERKNFIEPIMKQSMSFTTNKLTDINQEAVVDYEVTNASRIYDADVKIVCNMVDNNENIIESNDFVIMNYEPKNMIIEAGKTKTGKITARLIKSSVEDQSVKVKCTLDATATERESLGDEFIDLDRIGGTLMPLTLNEENNQITNGKIWDKNISYRVTKVVFEKELNPHETTPELTFDISEAQDGSVMAYLVENDDTLSLPASLLQNLGLDSNAKCFDLYVQSDGKILANANSSFLFYGFMGLKTIEGLEILNKRNITDMSGMFTGCMSLTSLDLSDFDTSNVTNMEGTFSGCSNLTTLDVSNFDTSKVTNMTAMFNSCSKLTTLNLSNFNTSNVTSMKAMFGICGKLTTLDLSNFNTGNVLDMSNMFYRCSSLTTLDLSNFNTSNVIDMDYMFQDCSSLTSLDLSNFDTSNVMSMLFIFYNCSSLITLDLSNFNTKNITYMRNMFCDCSSLVELDLSSFDTSNVADMSWMFSNCSSLTKINTSSFDTRNVTRMEGMFSKCSSLTSLDLRNFDICNVTAMYDMFQYCSSLTTLDISSFDMSGVEMMSYVFDEMPANAIIKVKDVTAQNMVLSDNGTPSEWTTENVIIATEEV